MRESSRWSEVSEHGARLLHPPTSPVTVRDRDTLASVKHRRQAATLAVAGLLSLQVTGNAAADPSNPPLLSEQCKQFSATPSDSIPRSAWHLERLQMESVWKVATGKGITVAVIDTGVATVGSPFLDDGRVTTLNYLGEATQKDVDANGMDCIHGTQVVSLIAAGRPDGNPVDPRTNFAGIAPDARVISYRTLSSSPGQGSTERDPIQPTIDAVKDATARDVDIINLSQSVYGDPRIDAYGEAIAAALAKGIVVVAAAGNADTGQGPPSFPAAFPGVIAVGISTRSDSSSELSLPGPYVSVGAPGMDLLALGPSISRKDAPHTNQAYESGIDGTSFAAPIVSGVVALMLEKDTSLTPQEVKSRLEMTADLPGTTIPDSRIGHGIVNPMRAVAGVPRPSTRNPDADTVLPVDPLPTREEPNMRPAVIAVSVGVGALVLASVGLVTAIAVPAAARRNKEQASQ